MSQTRYTLVVLVGLLSTFGASCAFANGINPPRPRDAATVKAICTTKAQQNEKEIFRAQISGAEPSELIHLRIAGVVEEASIADIMSIRFVSSNVANDGYLAAKLLRPGAKNDEVVSVQVRTGKTDLVLAGFSNTGSAVRVRLSDCAVIDFSASSNSSDAPHHPVYKK